MDMWKKSEILKNKKFRILLLLEVLLLLVPVIGILCGNKTISTLADAQVTTAQIRLTLQVMEKSTENCWKTSFPCIPGEQKAPVRSM